LSQRFALWGLCWENEIVIISSILLLQPERINPELNQKGYNVKSDVWSLGITMVTPRAWTRTLQPWVGVGSVLVGL